MPLKSVAPRYRHMLCLSHMVGFQPAKQCETLYKGQSALQRTPSWVKEETSTQARKHMAALPQASTRPLEHNTYLQALLCLHKQAHCSVQASTKVRGQG